MAAQVLTEECARRSGVMLPVTAQGDAGRPTIRLSIVPLGAEAYRIRTNGDSLTLEAADGRAALYAVGHLLRQMDWAGGKLELAGPLNVETKPRYALRGHQLGFRTTANSWDFWTVEQFDQHIRELALFGANAIENIPFQDTRPIAKQKVTRAAMNTAMSEICRKYGLEYWVWVPADFELKDAAKRAEFFAQYDAFLESTPHLTAIFVPGGDPGSNPPELVLPFLADLSKHAAAKHPGLKIWLSLQGFNKERTEAVYQWIDKGAAPWFGGIVFGPSSPSLAEARRRLPKSMPIRLYPDLTHNKISQYEVPQWDQAYALTLGREAINPRPAEYTKIFHRTAPLSNGFLSYSDGVHDDVNKNLWSMLAWAPGTLPRDFLIEYARFHFGHAKADKIADAMLALERNWRGPLVNNGAVESTLETWLGLERELPSLATNWRWQMMQLRATYDAYVRRRLLQANALEAQANAAIAQAATLGAEAAMKQAAEALAAPRVAGELRARIIDLCERLFQSIALQTSVEKYQASGAERGAVLDFIDHPLNNEWWLTDEFAKVRKMASEEAKVKRLLELARWETPGEGSFYDAVGILSKATHVLPQDDDEEASPLYWWWDQGKSRARLAWQATRWPRAVVYDGLDAKATYVIRTGGYGQSLLKVNGTRVTPTVKGKEMGEFMEFPVPAAALKEGKITLTWDLPTDEGHLNWRQKSRLAEVWLLKK